MLVTGFDIIFFWVARMMMMGLEFMGNEPFHTVYVHALVRDEQGQKMSKTKGNVIDPLKLVDDYGADATRFTLAAMAAQGRDMRLAMSRVEGYRNFVTKLWNAARFLEMNGCARARRLRPEGAQAGAQPLDRRRHRARRRRGQPGDRGLQVQRSRQRRLRLRLGHLSATGTSNWPSPCSPASDAAGKAETQATAAFVLDQILKLLHPFMPFVTEELWARDRQDRPGAREAADRLRMAELAGFEDPQADAEIEWLIALVSGIRSVRTEMNVPAGAKMKLVIVGGRRGDRHRASRASSRR